MALLLLENYLSALCTQLFYTKVTLWEAVDLLAYQAL